MPVEGCSIPILNLQSTFCSLDEATAEQLRDFISKNMRIGAWGKAHRAYFSFRLLHIASGVAIVLSTDSSLRLGRPDLHRVADRMPRGPNTMMMVCGPEKLIDLASDVAFDNSFSFHHEVFHF
jgi:hypothetical protein